MNDDTKSTRSRPVTAGREELAARFKDRGLTSRDGTVVQAATTDVIDAVLSLTPQDGGVSWETIAETLCAVDGNGFLCDATPAQKSAYEIRAKAVAALSRADREPE